MISLLTGTPGTGKTAWIVNELFKIKAQSPEKLLFVHGIRNLRGIDYELIYCKSQLCDICSSKLISISDEKKQPLKYVEDWQNWKQPDSLVVVDEVQRIWRPRTAGSPVPDSVSALETSRHYGVDFFLISQGPHLFDNFVRLLIGRHIHLKSTWAGRVQYEWAECKQNVQSKQDAVTNSYTLPKKIYSNYDSAEVHTKQEKRKPLSFYAITALVPLFLLLSYFVYGSISKRLHPVENISQESGLIDEAGSVGVKPNEPAPSSTYPDFNETVEGKPESAPAYSEHLKVTSAPIIIGCVKTPASCKCYSRQAVKYQVSNEFCNEYMAGNYFNPYRTVSLPGNDQPKPTAK